MDGSLAAVEFDATVQDVLGAVALFLGKAAGAYWVRMIQLSATPAMHSLLQER